MLKTPAQFSSIWSEDGCYNTTLFQSTEEYLNYEHVSSLVSLVFQSNEILLKIRASRGFLFTGVERASLSLITFCYS